MKILVISDVHGNIVALNEVLGKVPHDVVVFAGDIVDYGPRPAECLEKIRTISMHFVRGNHDNAAGLNVDCHCSEKMHALSVETRKYTRKVLNSEQLEFLRKMPLTDQFTIDGKRFFMVHASRTDPLYQYLKFNEAEKEKFIEEFGDIDADFIIYGHTHLPLVLKNIVRGTIINPGSVGQPRDGDPRASCAVIDTESNNVEIVRIPYDIGKVAKQIKEAHLPEILVSILKQQF
jgi:putative phosphoesterase